MKNIGAIDDSEKFHGVYSKTLSFTCLCAFSKYSHTLFIEGTLSDSLTLQQFQLIRPKIPAQEFQLPYHE